MANAKSGNVWRIDTTGNIPQTVKICALKFIAGSGSPSASITKLGGTVVMWETDSTSDIQEQLEISSNVGLTVTLGGTGTVLYLYEE